MKIISYKKNLLVLILCLFILQCWIKKQVSTAKISYEIIFPTEIPNRIVDGDIEEIIYRVKNTGNSKLKISSVRANCGCIVPEWSRDLINVNTESLIRLKFYSKGKGSIEGESQSYRVWIKWKRRRIISRISSIFELILF